MAKVSPNRNVFNGGEFSALVEGRVDIDRYGASMRAMLNYVAAPQGPAMLRSGTQYLGAANSHTQNSKLIPFVFNEDQSMWLEFCHLKMRIILPDGILIDGGSPYSITTPYSHLDVHKIWAEQSVDVVYLFCPGYRPRKLSRNDTYDWTIEEMKFDNGPFMPVKKKNGRLTLSATGQAAVHGTTGTATSLTEAAGFEATKAFDPNIHEYWKSTVDQVGAIVFAFDTPTVIDGYVVYRSIFNTNEDYSALDLAPGDWSFEAQLGAAAWETLDRQSGFIIYENGRTPFIKFNNTKAYDNYRLRITSCTRNGPIAPRVGYILMSEPETTIGITLNAPYDDLNDGQGFLATDVGRLIRAKDIDGHWRVLKITARASATSITAELISEPFSHDLTTTDDPILDWQIGYFSDTLGWPTCGKLLEDRLWVAGIAETPDLIVGSRTGAYEDYQQQTPLNDVLDDSAIVVRLNARKLSRVLWMESDERGLLLGTGSAEYVIQGSDTNQAITARNIKAREHTKRGSAQDVHPVKVDRQVLFVQNSRRTLREYAYNYEVDGYKAPSMSLFASHLGTQRFAEIDFAAEPHNILWLRREDGSVVAMTYNRDENVIGWHRHNFADGEVQSLCVIPSSEDNQDVLGMVVRRMIDGNQRQYIEKLTRFWDFDSTIDDAHFVDSALRYSGSATDELSGLDHLEGKEVVGLADGIPFGPVTVVSGDITLPFEAEEVIAGLKYDNVGETSRPDDGARDGTAQGKVKRIHNNTVQLWDSYGGEIGVYNEETKEVDWVPIEYEEPYDELEPPALQTGMFGPSVMPPGYNKRSTLFIRQTVPLPLNVVSLLPQMNTQDR